MCCTGLPGPLAKLGDTSGCGRPFLVADHWFTIPCARPADRLAFCELPQEFSMPDTNSSAPRSSNKRLWILGGILLASVGATVLVALISVRRDVSPDECLKLEQLKNISIAHLENGRHKEKRGIGQGELSRADDGFAELAKKLPNDPLAVRNLAITRLLELRDKQISPERAEQAAEQMLAMEERSPDAHLLAGYIAAEAGNQPRAVAELARAAELAPEDASIWYAISRLWTDSQDDAEKQRGYEALGRALRAEPDNLFLQAAWITAQARAKDPELAETLTALRETLASKPALNENLRKHGRISDPLALVDEAQEAVKSNQWAVAGRVLGLANVIRAETWSLNDLRRVDRDPLEFIHYDFRTPCEDNRAAARTAPHEVKFNELPASQQLPPLLGVADARLADMDLDGLLDIVALRETSVEIYGRANVGSDWRPVASSPLPAGLTRLLLVDLDQDDPEQPGTSAYAQRGAAGKQLAEKGGERRPSVGGAEPRGDRTPTKPCHRTDLDVVAYGDAGFVILRNELNADGQSRVLKTQESPAFSALGAVLAAAAVDFDHDGDLDLVISNGQGLTLWANHGDFTFDNVSTNSQLPPAALGATAIVPVDWDRDVDVDLILAGPGEEPAGWLENLRHGQFRWRTFGDTFAALTGASSAIVFDADGNGSWALAAAGKAGLSVVRTEPVRDGPPPERASVSIANGPQAQVQACDYDNDGCLDLISRSEAAVDIYRGDHSEFSHAPQLLARAAKPIRTVQTGDLDGDGDLDLAIAETDRIVLYANEGGNKNHWLNIELVAGLTDQQNLHFRVNHYGIGSLIEVRAGPIYQRQIVQENVTHFGLGQRGAPDTARVVWTNGIPQDIVQPQPNESLCEAQILGGSCPYVYTWTGEGFEFFSDCLWAAPLGLQLADGVLAPSRAWEYLLVPSDRLKACEGRYRLQITEELWEALYLDAVQLIAVDHPAEVAIYSNEKVGPAELAELKIHTARAPRRPKAARDQHGRDVLDRVALVKEST
jgi:tetratricopeptide (TPR) repeat protein